MDEFNDEQRAIIARSRSRLRWIDTLAGPDRQLAILGVPEAEWPAYAAWVSEAEGLMAGRLIRRWNAHEGYWTTEKAPR